MGGYFAPRNEAKLTKGRFFMDKRKICIIALITFIIAVAVVYAAQYTEPVFSGTGTQTLKVQNPNNDGTTLSGVVCVTFENGDKSSTCDVNYTVEAGKTATYSIPGKIKFWSSTYCYVQ